MTTELIILETAVFGLALWLGLYLIGRDLQSTRLRLAGLGLVSFALVWALELLGSYAPDANFGLAITRLRWSIVFLPAFFWTGALIYSLPEEATLRLRLAKAWQYALLPLVTLLFLVGISTDLVVENATATPRNGVGYFVFGAVAVLPMLAVLGLVWQMLRAGGRKNVVGLFITSMLFFAFSTGLLLLPTDWLPRVWVLLSVGLDIFLLGVAIAVWDAFDQGEALTTDFFRAFDFAFLTVLLFGGQVALVIIIGTGLTFPMLVLLLTTIFSAIVVQTFSYQIQGAIMDRLVFVRSPRLRQEQADLRDTARALPRVNETLDLAGLDEAEFIRLTRRALSHFGDLSRLASSPLTFLPSVESRLAERGAKDDALERAAELKALLTESVIRLKPRGKGDFGTSDEWRYYNALYFPYIVGLKPYSTRALDNKYDAASQAALEWFRLSVPERTLYNWQSAAAKLVAQDLKQAREISNTRTR